MDNAVAEFDRIYFSNLRIRIFYNAACEAVHYAMLQRKNGGKILQIGGGLEDINSEILKYKNVKKIINKNINNPNKPYSINISKYVLCE